MLVTDGKVGEGLFGLGQVVDLVASLFAAAAADAAGGIVQDAVAVFIVREHMGAAGLGHLCRAQCGSDASAAQDGQKFSTIHNRTLQLVGVLGRTRLVAGRAGRIEGTGNVHAVMATHALQMIRGLQRGTLGHAGIDLGGVADRGLRWWQVAHRISGSLWNALARLSPSMRFMSEET